MSMKRKLDASPNSKVPLMTSASQVPLVSLSPSRTTLEMLDDSPRQDVFSNNGYIGSKATMTTNLSDSRDEIEIIVDNSVVKSGLDDSDSTDSDDSQNGCMGVLETFQARVDEFYAQNKKILKWIFYILLLIGYAIYFIWALVLDFHRAISLFVITVLVVVMTVYGILRDRFGATIAEKCCVPLGEVLSKRWHILRWFVYIGLVVSIAVFLGVTVGPRPKQFVSIGGLFFFTLVLFVFSKHPSKARTKFLHVN